VNYRDLNATIVHGICINENANIPLMRVNEKGELKYFSAKAL
jgi:hypothetical protein